jgi:arginyl-tRNA synthetase
MLLEDRQNLAEQIRQAVLAVANDPQFQAPEVTLERPRQTEHGDLACNIAMQLAKPLRSNPRQIAERLVEVLSASDSNIIDTLEVAGPGFINIRLTAATKQRVVHTVLDVANQFGRGNAGNGQQVLVEFVSANPTGPLHVGHGRQAVLGDCIAALLSANGWAVHREFYYNDAGAQIDNLALSVQARAHGKGPDDASFPDDGYRGEYIADIAAEFLAGRAAESADRDTVTGNGNADDLASIREFAVAYLRREQDLDLRSFGVSFDRYYLESSLYDEGRVEQTVGALIDHKHTFEADGALWLKTTDYGDDKDRVMRKSDGGYTYFVPDVAYHVTKWERGFTKVINVQGSDHHGTIARVRAGLQALEAGIAPGFPDYVLHKMVTVMRGGQEVKISKRAGAYVTLRDLIDWCGGEQNSRGRDAVRFFLISRKADTEFVFDVDLAVSRSDENPVYYVQYAHARICSVLAADAQENPEREAELLRDPTAIDLASLTHDREFALMSRLAGWPELVRSAADDMAPHTVAFYLKDLAAEVHSYYNAERFLVDDESLRSARLALLMAARQVLQNGVGTPANVNHASHIKHQHCHSPQIVASTRPPAGRDSSRFPGWHDCWPGYCRGRCNCCNPCAHAVCEQK